MRVLRTATLEDVPALERLIGRSARALAKDYYSANQIDGALGSAWGVDTQLIRDGTYFVVEVDSVVAGSGGWSRRKTLFGADAAGERAPELLDPVMDAARIRAFFVAPEFARKGIAKALLERCEIELQAEDFERAELVATLPGVPFYRANGYTETEQIQHRLPNGLNIEFVRMQKVLAFSKRIKPSTQREGGE